MRIALTRSVTNELRQVITLGVPVTVVRPSEDSPEMNRLQVHGTSVLRASMRSSGGSSSSSQTREMDRWSLGGWRILNAEDQERRLVLLTKRSSATLVDMSTSLSS